MKQITFNPNNEPYYSEDFIKGFKCGAERQFEADKADRPQGEWIDRGMRVPSSWIKKCSLCGYETDTWRWCNYCPSCGARMKGADDE